MKKGKETRGRKPKKHEPLASNFNEVLGAIADSEYKDAKTLKANKKSYGK